MSYDLKMFTTVDKSQAQSARTSMPRHLWFLTPELVILALIDKSVSTDEKQLMETTLDLSRYI
jgi:hypothetical protein